MGTGANTSVCEGFFDDQLVETVPAPEPASAALIAIGFAGAALRAAAHKDCRKTKPEP